MPETQTQQTFEDQTLTCPDCNKPFVLTAGEQSFFASKGLYNPRRCKPCRQARREAKESGVDISNDHHLPAFTPEPPFEESTFSRGGGSSSVGGNKKHRKGGGGGGSRRHRDDERW